MSSGQGKCDSTSEAQPV